VIGPQVGLAVEDRGGTVTGVERGGPAGLGRVAGVVVDLDRQGVDAGMRAGRGHRITVLHKGLDNDYRECNS